MQLNIKLGFLKKQPYNHNPSSHTANNFFLQNSTLKHKKKSKSPPTKQNSFRNSNSKDKKQRQRQPDFIFEEDDGKELILTDRDKKKQRPVHHHRRSNSTTKKTTKSSSAYHSGINNNLNLNHPNNDNFLSHHTTTSNSNRIGTSTTHKTSSYQGGMSTNVTNVSTVKASSSIHAVKKSKPKVSKNCSDLIKATKKKIAVINNSSLGDEQSLKGSIPGWSGQRVTQRFGPLLTENQKIQLINEKEVYYIGVGTGYGEDDLNGAYQWKKHEQVGFRYELLEPLGSGAFGQVVKAFDHKCKEHIAVKIIRSKKQHMQLALNEINILMKAKQKDIQNQKNILRIKDFIVFRKHICIITQLLSISLYQLLQQNNFSSIDMNYIRTFAIQILNALAYLKEIKVIHSDLKPQNVMLKSKSKTGIKLIDFGTSMFSNQTSFLYIQSRFYRAPEVILNTSYDYSIDMWSFGCLLAELYLGEPIFAGSNEQEQLALIMEVLGCPSKEFINQKCNNSDQYFGSDGSPKLIKSKQGKVIKPDNKKLYFLIKDKLFCQYLSKILVIEPNRRYSPLQALLDPWIIEGLPEQIKQQHLSFIKMKMKQQKKLSKSKQPTSSKHKKTKHRKQSTVEIPQTVRKHQIKDQPTVKKHKRRVSDINNEKKFEQASNNIRANHMKHKRRGSTGIF